jgi:hypothetical protein
MSLYLCVFRGETEVEGVEVGSYADFSSFRQSVCAELEDGQPGCRFPTLMLHSDCDGEWDLDACMKLRAELTEISEAFKTLPPEPYPSTWQRDLAKSLGMSPMSLHDSFIDVDGEPLIERLLTLCQVALAQGEPILFQ